MKICLHTKDDISCHDPVEGQAQKNFNQGGSYTIFARVTAHNQLHVDYVDTVVKSNQVHVLWQIPQYILLTAAEVMFSIPSMQFAYTQVSTYTLKNLAILGPNLFRESIFRCFFFTVAWAYRSAFRT